MLPTITSKLEEAIEEENKESYIIMLPTDLPLVHAREGTTDGMG